MNRLLTVLVVPSLLLFATIAGTAKQHEESGYQTATVVGIESLASASSYVGVSPTDAPPAPETYSYDVKIRVNCNVYVARYESPTDYLPASFAPNHTVDIRVTRHVLYVSLPAHDREIKMSIVGRTRLKEQACPVVS